MNPHRESRIHPGWWTTFLLLFIVAVVAMTVVLFGGLFRTFVPVTVTSHRSGLIMEPGGQVKMRGLQVGRVSGVNAGIDNATLDLEIDPRYVEYIPANVVAEIDATTAFGSKYVDLVYPEQPSPERVTAGQVLYSRNVASEVNTVFQNIVELLDKVDPAKLNSILSALAEGLRGQGEEIGRAITGANRVLLAVNPRSETVRADWRSLRGFSAAYGVAAEDIMQVLDSLSTTSVTVTDHSRDLDALLINVVGLADSGIGVLAPSKDNLVTTVGQLAPTTALLHKYHPSLTCTLLGAKWFIDNGGAQAEGGNGYSIVLDSALALGQDPYRYPDNLPIVGAKGGPGGKPGCGSLPDVTKQFPVRQLVTNTGWGTGNDIRVNPGIGFPGWANYFPVTRAVPEPPSVRNIGGPAPGPVPPLGAPPYGAQQYAPDGTPLYPALPPAPPPGAPREPGPTPGSEPFVPFAPANLLPTPLPPPPPPAPQP
ncbi:MAG: MCE family protein [Mycolicibacterium sp.]